MSGIYIKGMEMPRRCEECPCMCEVDIVQGFACGCKLTMKIREIDNDTRPSWCTLIPVPDHGRLIDADALDADLERQDMRTGEYDAIGFSITEIENAPTIITADKEGKK